MAKNNTVEKLNKLLESISINDVYYVDDENNLSDIEIALATGELTKIFESGNQEKLLENKFSFYEQDDPIESTMDKLNASWDSLGLREQKRNIKLLIEISQGDKLVSDSNRVSRLKQQLPNLKSLSPHEWDEQKSSILGELSENKKILILFDEDLYLAGTKYLSRKGQDLIVETKNQDNGYIICALLTHLITDIKDELKKRKEIVDKRSDLKAEDFFPLSKSRLDDPEVFADGIKKTLINSYFEKIKTESINIIKSSSEEAINLIKDFDPYDFEDTILKAAYSEGLWEPETIFRLFKIKFDNELKSKMVETGYVKKVNKELKEPQKTVKINFKVERDVSPYSEKYKLRRSEIYDDPLFFNQLKKPIENGDIYEFGNSKFILANQSCDLMVRVKGKRKNNVATLLKILLMPVPLGKKIEDVEKDMLNNSSQYPLSYFTENTKSLAYVNFKDPILINLNLLDLCVYNTNGECKINMTNPDIDKDTVSYSWLNRFAIIMEGLSIYNKKIKIVHNHIKKFNSPAFKILVRKFYPRIIVEPDYLNNNLLNLESVDNIDFSIRRISKLKEPYSDYLLDKYSKYTSRAAFPHDFALK